jgi:hypothetical protein
VATSMPWHPLRRQALAAFCGGFVRAAAGSEGVWFGPWKFIWFRA